VPSPVAAGSHTDEEAHHGNPKHDDQQASAEIKEEDSGLKAKFSHLFTNFCWRSEEATQLMKIFGDAKYPHGATVFESHDGAKVDENHWLVKPFKPAGKLVVCRDWKYEAEVSRVATGTPGVARRKCHNSNGTSTQHHDSRKQRHSWSSPQT